jgi:hypothetical protein
MLKQMPKESAKMKTRYFLLLSIVPPLLAGMLSTQAAVKVFRPAAPTETFSEDNFTDDDVDVTSNAAGPYTLAVGDRLVWDFNYSQCYHVESDDAADIDVLQLFGASVGNSTIVVNLQFSDCEHKLFGPVYTRTATWGAGNATIWDDFQSGGAADGDDLLGNLEGKEIKDFHLEVRVTAGFVTVNRIDFAWEAWDIDAVPCPVPDHSSTFCLLTFAVMAMARFRGAVRS